MNFVKRKSRKGDRITFYYDFGRKAGQLHKRRAECAAPRSRSVSFALFLKYHAFNH